MILRRSTFIFTIKLKNYINNYLSLVYLSAPALCLKV